MSNLISAIILLTYYLVVCFAIPTMFKAWTRVPNEVIRKFQHVAYSLSVFILLQLFSTWYYAIAAAFLLVLLAYPVLMAIEKLPGYKRFFTDRNSRGGELRKQLLFVQLTFALLILFFWGLLGTQWHYLVAVSVMGWAFGDAAAALVGKFLGRKVILHRFIEGAKTLEGTGAMIIVAAVALFLTLMFFGGKPWHTSLLVAVIVAPGCGMVELFSRWGTDTLTVPLFTGAVVLPLVYLFSLLGW